MGELTKKRVHWTEYNGNELIADEDVDILTSADAVTFDDGEDLQHKYTQGQFVSPSVTGLLANLSTLNTSTLVDAINEVNTNGIVNQASIESMADRVTPISLGGTGATTVSEARANLDIFKIYTFSGNGNESRVYTLDCEPKFILCYLKNQPFMKYDATNGYTLCSAGIAVNGSVSTIGMSLSGKNVTTTQSTKASNGVFINLNKYLSQYCIIAFK